MPLLTLLYQQESSTTPAIRPFVGSLLSTAPSVIVKVKAPTASAVSVAPSGRVTK